MIKFLFALLLVGICFVLYLMTLEFRDINKKIKFIENELLDIAKRSLDTTTDSLDLFDEFSKQSLGLTKNLMKRIALVENNVARIKIEQRKAMNQSVYDNDFVDIEKLKKEVEAMPGTRLNSWG